MRAVCENPKMSEDSISRDNHRTGMQTHDIASPRSSHDGWTFESLAAAYNYDNTSDRRATLVDLVVQESRKRAKPVCILDIGCGTGISEDASTNVSFLKTVRENCDHLWGI